MKTNFTGATCWFCALLGKEAWGPWKNTACLRREEAEVAHVSYHRHSANLGGGMSGLVFSGRIWKGVGLQCSFLYNVLTVPW